MRHAWINKKKQKMIFVLFSINIIINESFSIWVFLISDFVLVFDEVIRKRCLIYVDTFARKRDLYSFSICSKFQCKYLC